MLQSARLRYSRNVKTLHRIVETYGRIGRTFLNIHVITRHHHRDEFFHDVVII